MEYIFKTNHIRLTFNNLSNSPITNCIRRLQTHTQATQVITRNSSKHRKHCQPLPRAQSVRSLTTIQPTPPLPPFQLQNTRLGGSLAVTRSLYYAIQQACPTRRSRDDFWSISYIS
jgi:hypothetical protein